MKIERMLTTYPFPASNRIEAEKKNTLENSAVSFDNEKKQKADEEHLLKEEVAEDAEEKDEKEEKHESEALLAHKKILDVRV